MGKFINLFLSQNAVLNSETQRAVLRIQVDRRERSVLALGSFCLLLYYTGYSMQYVSNCGQNSAEDRVSWFSRLIHISSVSFFFFVLLNRSTVRLKVTLLISSTKEKI